MNQNIITGLIMGIALVALFGKRLTTTSRVRSTDANSDKYSRQIERHMQQLKRERGSNVIVMIPREVGRA